MTPTKVEELVQFLYSHLDKFGDDIGSIRKSFEYLIDRGGSLFVAEQKSRTAGATIILETHMSEFLPENFLVYIAVDPDFRGRGVGKRILDYAKSDLQGGIALHVEPENPAKRLYEREGFTNKYLEMRYQP